MLQFLLKLFVALFFVNQGIKVRPIVLFGPSGCGKSTLKNRLMKDYPDKFGFSVSRN